MTVIKDFPRDLYGSLTSLVKVLHRKNCAPIPGQGRSHEILLFHIDRLHRQIPVPIKNLKPPLLFALEGLLIGIHLLL
jgi:hypothetical protein